MNRIVHDRRLGPRGMNHRIMALIGCEGVIIDLGNTVEGVVMDGRNLGIGSRPRWQEDGGGGGGVAAGTAK